MNQYDKTQVEDNILQPLELPSLPMNSNDTFVVIETKYDRRPDKMAHDLYGNERYYYVFLLANMDQMEDPVFDFKSGMTIRVPSRENIRRMN